MLPYCGPCCATPSLGRSPRANRCENWWLTTCAHLQKNISKICDFHFSFDLHTDIILKQFNKWKNTYIFFTFLCCFPFCFPRCASLLWSPLYYPVALPRCWVEVLEPTVAKTDDLGLVPILKNISKICDFRFFSFDLCTGIILKQLNKIQNLNIFFFHFSFFSVVSPVFFFPLCFPIVVPVVLPRCSPHCGATGTAEATGNCSLSFSTNARPPTRARVGAKRSPRLVALGSPPGGDTTGRYNGETQRGNLQTKRETK